MHRIVRRLLVALTFVAALPAHAGIFDDEEARAQIVKLRSDVNDLIQRLGQIDQHLGQLDQRNETLSRSQLDLANQLVAIPGELAKLRGQLEVLTYELEAAQKRQKDFYVDLDNRLRKLEQQATQQAEQQKATAAAAAGDPQAETRDYEAALTAFKATKYKDAASAFLGFIKAYPNSTLQPSAHYWAAAALRKQRELGEAAKLFAEVADRWPDDPKAAEALLAQADCEHEENQVKNERRILEKLVTRYPESDAAQSAKSRLKKK